MHKLGTGYTMYFNQKYQRSGSLFQGPFKSVHINSNNQFLWVSAYINANAEIHGIANAKSYRWSSYLDYLGKRNSGLCNRNVVLEQFKDAKEYQKFVEEVIERSRRRKQEIKDFETLVEGGG